MLYFVQLRIARIISISINISQTTVTRRTQPSVAIEMLTIVLNNLDKWIWICRHVAVFMRDMDKMRLTSTISMDPTS